MCLFSPRANTKGTKGSSERLHQIHDAHHAYGNRCHHIHFIIRGMDLFAERVTPLYTIDFGVIHLVCTQFLGIFDPPPGTQNDVIVTHTYSLGQPPLPPACVRTKWMAPNE